MSQCRLHSAAFSLSLLRRQLPPGGRVRCGGLVTFPTDETILTDTEVHRGEAGAHRLAGEHSHRSGIAPTGLGGYLSVFSEIPTIPSLRGTYHPRWIPIPHGARPQPPGDKTKHHEPDPPPEDSHNQSPRLKSEAFRKTKKSPRTHFVGIPTTPSLRGAYQYQWIRSRYGAAPQPRGDGTNKRSLDSTWSDQ